MKASEDGTETVAPTTVPGTVRQKGPRATSAGTNVPRAQHNREDFEHIRNSVSLREFCENHLERKGRTYVCPACGSGTGPNGTPAFSLNTNGERNQFGPTRWRCFACDRSGDVFDLYGTLYGCKDDRVAQLHGVAKWAHVPIEGAYSNVRHAPMRRGRTVSHPATRPGEAAEISRSRNATVAKLLEAREAIEDPRALSFLASHGLGVEAARRHGLGFTDSYRLGGRHYPALLIPYPGSPWYYTARMLDSSAPHKYDKPKTEVLGREPLWNPTALGSPAFVVVEGQMDALAVTEAGFEAVALGTSGSTRPLVEALIERRYGGCVLIMTDHDAAGMEGCARTGRELDALRAKGLRLFPCVFPWPDDAPKDAAEWLAADPEGLRSALAWALATAADGRERANAPLGVSTFA